MAKNYKQNTWLESYKNESKILANPGLAYSGFEQPGPAVLDIFKYVSRVLIYFIHQ